MATRRKVEFQGTFDIQAILNAVDTLQNRLNKVQLDDSSARRFERTFADLKKRAQEIDAEIKQGFTNTSQINTFNNHLQKLGQQMEILKGEIGRVDTSFSNLQLSPTLQKQFENLKNSANSIFDAYENQIASIESKISSFASKTGMIFAPEEITGLAKAITSTEKLNKLQNEKQASLQQERADIQANISAREESLRQAQQEVILARQNQEAIAAQLVAQKEKIASMRGEGANTASLQKQVDIQKDLTAKNNEAREAVLRREKAQEEILQNLKSEQDDLAKVESSLFNITKFFNSLKGDSSGLDDDAAAAAKEFTDLSNKVSQLEKQLEQANLELQKFKDLQSKKVSTGLDSSVNDIDRFKVSLDKASDSTVDMTNNLDKLNKQDEFFNNLKSRATAVFGLTNAFIYMNRFIRESVTTIKELDAAFIEIAVVTNMTTEQLWESFDTYNEMAQKLGTTTVDAIKTSALYYQQGLDTAEVMILTEETMKMARIAGMDFAEATDRMTAALRGFKLEMSEASRVNDVFSALAAESAVDTDELSYALTKTASIAQSAGMELETTSAFLSQMIETTREAPENIGTAMKTIIARFQELKTAVGDSVEIDGELVDVNKVDTALKSVGVQLRDNLTGQFRDLDDVFLELASKWDTLDRNTQRYVATIAAGSRQQSRFIAMMDNYERTLELVDIAQNSNRASAAQFAKTLDSVETKINNIKSSFEEFVGTLVKSDFVKDVLDGINNVLQFINDIAENGEVAFAAFVAVAIISIKKIINNFISGAKTASGLIGAVRDSFLGDSLEKIKNHNEQSIKDLENRIRNSSISEILSQKISTGIQNGANQTSVGASTTGKPHSKNQVIVTEGQEFNVGYLKKVRDKLKTGGLSNEDRTFLKENGVNLGKNNTALLQNVEELINSKTATGKLTNAINTLGPAISSVGSAISSVLTSAVLMDAAQKGTTALGGATAGSAVGGTVGAGLGALLQFVGIPAPIGMAIGSAIGTPLGGWIGEGIATGLDNAKYGIGSQESIKKFQEEAQKVAEETSKSIEENQGLVELGEEYLSLSEKVNLTTEEKQRLIELNEQLINQWDGLSYVNSSENGLRSINIDQLKEEIKLKKQLIAEDTARTSFTNYQYQLSELTRQNKDAYDEAREQFSSTNLKFTSFYKSSAENYLDEFSKITGEDYGTVNLQAMNTDQAAGAYWNKIINSLDKDQLIENKELLDEFATSLGISEGYIASTVDQYIEVLSVNEEKLSQLAEELNSDISSILDAAFSGISNEAFSSQNKSYLNELLKIENLLTLEEQDALASGGLDYEYILNKRTELSRNFINNLDSFNEEEREVFSNAISMIGLFTDEEGNANSSRIIEYIESELGTASTAVQNAFNDIFKVEKDTLTENWNQILDLNKSKIDEIADSFAEGQGGAEIAAKFAQMTISAGDMGPAFISAFQKQFDELLNKYTEGEPGNRRVIEETAEEFEAVMEALSSTNVTSANSIAQLGTKLKELEYNEEEVLQITSSLGTVFGRTGLTAEEALTDIESQLEKVNSLIDILGANLEGSLSLSQLDQLNSQLEEMGQNIIDNSRIVATGDGFKITGDIGGIIGSGTEGTREYFLQMANQANAAKFVKEAAAAKAEENGEYERANELSKEATSYAKTSQYYLAAEAQIRANLAKQKLEEDNAEKKRQYDLIQQYKDMIAELERYYNIQRKLLQLQNEQTDFELDFQLANGSTQASEALTNQILNLVEQQRLLKQAGDIYSKDLKELGDYINQSYGQYLTVDESGNIFQNSSELEKLAEQMVGASEEEAAELEKLWDTIGEVQSAYEELYDTTISNSQEYKQNLIEQQKLEQQILQYQIDLEKTLRDIIIKDMQDEVKAVQDKYNKIKQEDQKYLSSLQKNINKRKQMQSDQDQDQEIASLQSRIGLLSRDTSGIYTKEIEDLQEQLDQLLEEKTNTTLDRLYEEEEAKTQKVADELTLRSEFLQQQLDLELETYAISNEKVAELLKLKDKEILEWMKAHSEEFRSATTAEQENFIITWSQQIEQGKAAQQTLTDDLENQKQAILNKFEEIETGGINKYIEAVQRADSYNIVLDIDDSQVQTALAELEKLDDKQNEMVKNEAKRAMDDLLVQIDNAYAAGNTAEGERLKKEYQNYYDLFKGYGGIDTEMDMFKYEGWDAYTGAQKGYYGAADRAQSAGEEKYQASHTTEGAGKEQVTYSGTKWVARSGSNKLPLYQIGSDGQVKVYTNHWGTNDNFGNGKLSQLQVVSEPNAQGLVNVRTPGLNYLDGPGIDNPSYAYMYIEDLEKLYRKYETGGVVDYTGPAWVDGTKSKPEAFLSASDTENIAKLCDILSKVFNPPKSNSDISGQNQNTGDTYYEFHITVDELGDGYDAKDMMKDMEKYIIQKSNYRKVTNLSRSR